MTIEDIRKRLTGGFVRFTIRTSDGEKFPVPHREFIFVTPRRVVVAVDPSGSQRPRCSGTRSEKYAIKVGGCGFHSRS